MPEWYDSRQLRPALPFVVVQSRQSLETLRTPGLPVMGSLPDLMTRTRLCPLR
jgi:hypothetical protein